MYDVSEFRINGKEIALAVLVVFILLVVAGSVGYLFGLRNAGAGVPNNGTGINDIREQYQQIENNQRELTNRLEDTIGRSDAAAQTVGRIEERIIRSENNVTEAGILIDECQQIIGQIRNRGTAGTQKN